MPFPFPFWLWLSTHSNVSRTILSCFLPFSKILCQIFFWALPNRFLGLCHVFLVALPSLSYQKQHTNNYIGNLTGIYHARSLGKIFSPNIRKRQDWAVWLEAIKKSGQVAVGIQEDLAFYRVRKGSMSSSKVKLVKYNFQFYRNYLKYSWGKSVVCLLRFFWEYFLVRPKYIKKL